MSLPRWWEGELGMDELGDLDMGKLLDKIVARPNGLSLAGRVRGPNIITCADGFSVSVISGLFVHCSPRGDVGPYDSVEVGFPSERPEPWAYWSERAESPDSPTKTVYGYVPVAMVQALIDLHGGEVES